MPVNRKIVYIISSVLFALAVAGWAAAVYQRESAARYRGRVDALEKAVEEMKIRNQENDREWKEKLDEAQANYEESEKRRKEAAAEFSKWKPAGGPPPRTTDEMVKRFKNAGVRAIPRGGGR